MTMVEEVALLNAGRYRAKSSVGTDGVKNTGAAVQGTRPDSNLLEKLVCHELKQKWSPR